ncbi:hypothetical protein [Saccharolobus islandicus]|uniref:hypothetical protein n=1 Tax=Saccharolobus islandicus TaxID=43080 RepID=UPI001CEF8FD7|nr:hypothetical protein [Sulfolobus islandicus]
MEKPIIFNYVLDELLTIMINRQPFEYVDKTVTLLRNHSKYRFGLSHVYITNVFSFDDLPADDGSRG